MPDCWLAVSIRKVLRPATSARVFLGFPVPGDRNVIKKEAEKILKYADLVVEVHPLRNV
jgi:hypothetical protein